MIPAVSSPPIDAARVAATESIRIYPIAIGDPEAIGEEAIDRLTLERMALVTGGRSFVAFNRTELDSIFALLADLEPTIFDSVAFRPRADLHWAPLALFALIYIALRVLSGLMGLRKVPSGHPGASTLMEGYKRISFSAATLVAATAPRCCCWTICCGKTPRWTMPSPTLLNPT